MPHETVQAGYAPETGRGERHAANPDGSATDKSPRMGHFVEEYPPRTSLSTHGDPRRSGQSPTLMPISQTWKVKLREAEEAARCPPVCG